MFNLYRISWGFVGMTPKQCASVGLLRADHSFDSNIGLRFSKVSVSLQEAARQDIACSLTVSHTLKLSALYHFNVLGTIPSEPIANMSCNNTQFIDDFRVFFLNSQRVHLSVDVVSTTQAIFYIECFTSALFCILFHTTDV